MASLCETCELPPGPSTLAEAMAWPSYVYNALFAEGSPGCEERKACLFEILHKHGLHVYSDYSGMDCPRFAMDEMCHFIDDQNAKNGCEAKCRVVYKRACDNGTYPSEWLTAVSHELDNGESCLFYNIEERLDKEASAELNKWAPKEDSSQVCKQKAYEAMSQCLSSRISAGLFHAGNSSHCSIHEDQCPVFDFAADCDGDNGCPPIRSLEAGNSCTDWSLAGLKAGEAGGSQR